MLPKTPDKLCALQFTKFLPEYLEYAERIRKTLYYGRLPSTDRPSLPLTHMSVEKFSELCRQDGLEKLDTRYASSVCYDACVTPCSLIVALLYLDRLRVHNPDYLANTSPSQVFLVATMVASKYLYDDGEEDEVFNDEWATSASLSLADLNQAEKEFLMAIDWNLFVDTDAFLCVFRRVEAEVSWQEGVKRGFFTYTDLLSLTRTLPTCSSFLNLVHHVLAVCIVGYTAAIVSIVAGTVLAQECGHQVNIAMQHLTARSTTTTAAMPNKTHAICFDDQLPQAPEAFNALVSDSLPSLADTNESTAEETEDSIVSLSGLPSRAITTLTTSILLAISSPSGKLHPRQLKKGHSCSYSPDKNEQGDSMNLDDRGTTEMECDPTDVHLTFTTGPYWPPSSYAWRSDHLLHFPVEPPCFDLGLRDEHTHGQKQDWIYSNPWVIPWLSWHGTPVYSIIQNFSGIGAPNLQSFKRTETTWQDCLAWMSAFLMELVIDFTPSAPSMTLAYSSVLSSAAAAAASVAPTGPEPVPWLM